MNLTAYYEEKANALSHENYLLHESDRDLKRVRRALGDETVDDAIEWAREQEMAENLASPTGKGQPKRSSQNRSDWEAR